MQSLCTPLLCRKLDGDSIAGFPTPNHLSYGMIPRTDSLGEFGHAHTFSVVFNNPIGALVSLLLFLCCPTTVLLGISQIIVDPVYGVMGGWALAHILKKILVSHPPSRNSKVSFEIPPRLKRLVGRAGFHVAPAAICPVAYSGYSGFGVAVFLIRSGYLFCRTSSATGASTCPELIAEYVGCLAARASAYPPCIPSLAGLARPSDHSPFSKCLIGNILHIFMEGVNRILVLAHASDGLSSSGPRSAPTDGGCELFKHT